jgi:hypothetical protein
LNKLQIGLEVETQDGKCFEIVHIYENDVLASGTNDVVEVVIKCGEILIMDKKTKNMKIVSPSELLNS